MGSPPTPLLNGPINKNCVQSSALSNSRLVYDVTKDKWTCLHMHMTTDTQCKNNDINEKLASEGFKKGRKIQRIEIIMIHAAPVKSVLTFRC